MPVTPQGTIVGFVAIEKPSDKFGPATYSCKMAFTGAEAKSMKANVDKHMAESMAKSGDKGLAKPPYVVVDKQLICNFKQKAEITTKAGKTFEFTIKLFDASGNEVEEVLNIGEGTQARISYEPYMWSVPSQGGAGCTLQLSMVQIIKLVAYAGGTGGNPFDAVEGDFTAAKKDSNPFTQEAADNRGDEGDF